MIVRTPLIPYFGDPHTEIYLKPENLQRFGSYKIRGVANLLKKIDPAALKRGLAAASAGNMAQAVAFGAKSAGVPCTIFVPETAPDVKKQAIRGLGAELIELPYEEIWKLVRGERAPPADRFFVHPAFCAELLEGYGQIAVELINDLPDADAVVIPFGVGGLTIGMSRVLRKLSPEISVYGCEPETAAPLCASLKAGRATGIQRIPSFIDGIGTPEVLPRVFDEVSALGVGSLVVTLEETKAAIRELLQRHKLLCEGAGAAALAGALQLAKGGRHKRIAAVATGGNLPADILRTLW